MTSWWSKLRSTPEVFKWTDDRRAAFFGQFREDSSRGGLLYSPTVVLTEGHLAIDSWNNEEERTLLGWNPPTRPSAQLQSAGFIPVKITLHRTKDSFATRSSRSWSDLKPLGRWYLTDRQPLFGGTHGFEASIHLDNARMDRFLSTIQQTKQGASPTLTLGLRLDRAASSEQRVDVLAYWMTAWTLVVKSPLKHPWLSDLL